MNTKEIIIKASEQSEAYLKSKVRDRLTMKPILQGFICGMGVHFFYFVNGENDKKRVAPKTKQILEEFDLHFDSFGSFPWRIDLVDGKYIERTDW